MKTKIIIGIMIVLFITACFSSIRCYMLEKELEKPEESVVDPIVVGFSQLGAESKWRTANTESMKQTFTEENGYKLIFSDGQQKQANQIMAIRTFIQEGVDYIVLAPVTEKGWTTVLQEAKEAGIPVIIIDRMIDILDEELFTCYVGSDFELECKKTMNWLEQYIANMKIDSTKLRLVGIQGSLGASSQKMRNNALREATRENGWRVLAKQYGEYTRARGKEVMEDFLNKYNNINIVYCENDDEAFGAIDAIEAAGMKVGSDIANGEIMILSFDGVTEEALRYVKEDKITCISEYNPQHGPRVRSVIELMEAGETPDKYNHVDERFFCSNDIVDELHVDGVEYDITLLED